MTYARLVVDPTRASNEGIALLSIASDVGDLGRLNLEFSQLAPLGLSNPAALDFLLLATTVYGLDKMIARSTAVDNWTRDFSLECPVTRPVDWNRSRQRLADALGFLSGDRWDVRFKTHGSNVLRTRRPRRHMRRITIAPARADYACLFSGGLDSLVGVIDLLELEPANVMLIGHHDGQMSGPKSDQNGLLSGLAAAYPRRLHAVLPRIGHDAKASDITLRCRSLLFIALGMYGASSISDTAPLVVPENGMIALNVPLTPSRRGSCSTRTTHPAFLRDLGAFLHEIGVANPIRTPLEMKTKGEVVAECKNPALLRRLAPLSVSCAKRGHKRTWVHKTGVKSCGRCMPCIYRRAALNKVGWDSEQYGNDICRGDVDVDGPGEAAGDLRACLGFLRRAPTSADIQTALLCNGSLDVARLPAYADMVQRAMNEIRELIAMKGNARTRNLAGL